MIPVLLKIKMRLIFTGVILTVYTCSFSMAACNVRTKALGGAGCSLIDMPSCIHVNSAGLVFSPYSSISILYGNENDGSNTGYAEFSYPFAKWATIAAGVDIFHTDSSNYMQDYALALSFKLSEGIAFGASASSIKNTINGYYDTAYGVDAGILIRPLKFANIGIVGDNILSPEFSYEELGQQLEYTRDVRAGLNIFQKDYFNIVAELTAEDIDKVVSDTSYKASYGIEMFPDPSLAVRAGIKEDEWSIGGGIISKNMNFDYAAVSDGDGLVNYLQFVYKFGVAPSRKEMQLKEQEDNIVKREAYLQAFKYFNMGEIAAAQRRVEEYREKYGSDEKIEGLDRDITRWLNKVRAEKFGKAEELKKDILMDYYQGNLEDAMIKLDNLKLLAPNYGAVPYLQYILNAGMLLESGDYMRAEEELIEALKLEPDSKEVQDMYDRLREVIRLSE